MPTYQYACTDPDCGNRFELVQAFTDPAVTTCPVCAARVRKVYGSVGVVFKGSGFYRNDSRSEGGAKSSSTEPARSSKDGKESGSKESGSGKDSASSSSSSTESSSSSSSSAGSSGSSGSSGSTGASSGKAAASA